MFEQVVTNAVRRLENAVTDGLLLDFILIGGFAVSRWSVPRATADVDFAVRVEPQNLVAISKFLNGELRIGDPNDPLLATITFEEKDERGAVPIQLIQFPPSWEKEIFREVVKENLKTVKLPIINWKPLVLLKLYAGGPLDIQDVVNILKTTDPSNREIEELIQRGNALRVSKKLEKILSQLK